MTTPSQKVTTKQKKAKERKKYSHHDESYAKRMFGYELVKYALNKGVDSLLIEYKDVQYGTGNQGNWEIEIRRSK